MFTTFIVQPIFNLLVAIYALIPGHNFGLAIILFTVIIRLLLWPLVKKQLHQVKQMRKVQPELKRIKKAAAGDKRKEQMMMLELYKERGINPFGQIGILLLQIPILIGLYIGLQRVLKDQHEIISFAYPFLQDLSWLKQLAGNIHLFDGTLFGLIDLTKPALGQNGVYWPAMMLVAGSAMAQYFQSKQLSPSNKDGRRLRTILREAKHGKQADQSEVNAAMSRNMLFLLPALVFLFTVQLASALSLYWLVSGITAFIQQGIILRDDTDEMETAAGSGKNKSKTKTTVTISTNAEEREKKAVEAEIVETKKKPSKKAARKKRKKR
jgi:YidC/Oxa1 family membrane protein insertase